MDALREAIGNYTDDELLEVYRTQRGEYTEEAVRVFEEEIANRGLDAAVKAEERRETAEAVAEASVVNLSRDEFEPLKHPFSKADAVIANSILRDSKIPYFVEKLDEEKILCCAPVYQDVYTRASVLPADVTVPLFAVFVYKDALKQAYELIDEHFEPDKDGCYAPRLSDVIDRLKSFSPYDIQMSPAVAEEPLAADFSESEKSALIKLAETLVGEVDEIEEQRGRVVFFYDSMEELVGKLKKNAPFTRTDFLAIIELCQIYCEDKRYEPELNHVVSSILSFFLE